MLERLGRCTQRQAELCGICAGLGPRTIQLVHHRSMALQVKVHLLSRLMLLGDLLLLLAFPHALYLQDLLSSAFGGELNALQELQLSRKARQGYCATWV